MKIFKKSSEPDAKLVRPGLVPALLLILSITWRSIAQPLHNPHTSLPSAAINPTSAITLQTQEHISSNPASNTVNNLTLYTSSADATHRIALAKRGDSINLLPFKILHRHQHFLIYPSVLTVNAVVGFWQKVALETMYKNGLEAPTALFTITQGQLQATFSCLGRTMPWTTVYDVAVRVIQSVNGGLVDTFDLIYEEAGTGFTLWVSFQVLENKLDRKRKRPG